MDKHDVVIVENYKDYTPPFEVKEVVADLLAWVPAQYLHGLKEVVITNVGSLNRGRRRQKSLSRKRKIDSVRSLGSYYKKLSDRPAYIELFVDNITSQYWLTNKLFLHSMIRKVLFHEIGHHIHATRAPEHKESEDVAEEWRRRLSREYLGERYWYLKPFRPVFWILLKILKRLAR